MPLTPEQLVTQMSVAEVQELLEALELDHSAKAAKHLKLLVVRTDCLETSIETLKTKFSSRRVA